MKVTADVVRRAKKLAAHQNGLNQSEMAHLIGISDATMSRILQGYYDRLAEEEGPRRQNQPADDDGVVQEIHQLAMEQRRTNELLFLLGTMMVNAWLKGAPEEKFTRDILRKVSKRQLSDYEDAR